MKRVMRSTMVKSILNTNGKFFTVLFKKRKGNSLRLMNCKLNKDNLQSQLAKNLIPVYETGVGFRNIPTEGLVMVVSDGQTMRVRE